MCLPYAGMSASYEARVEAAATLITLLFMVEMIVKLLVLGCAGEPSGARSAHVATNDAPPRIPLASDALSSGAHAAMCCPTMGIARGYHSPVRVRCTGYWADGWNRLDGTIVTLSAFDLAFSAAAALHLLGGGDTPSLSFLRVLRMLRLLRALRLMRTWKGLYKIVMTLIRTLPQMLNILVLMGLVLLIFALLGMQLFGGAYDEAHGYGPGLRELPRGHFDYFGPAALSCFVMMTGSWYDMSIAAMEVVGPKVAFFFVVVVVVGFYLILNLFVAIVLEAFAEDADEDAPAEAPPMSPPPPSPALFTPGAARNDPDADMEAARARAKDRSLDIFSTTNPIRRLVSALVFHPRFDSFIIGVRMPVFIPMQRRRHPRS